MRGAPKTRDQRLRPIIPQRPQEVNMEGGEGGGRRPTDHALDLDKEENGQRATGHQRHSDSHILLLFFLFLLRYLLLILHSICIDYLDQKCEIKKRSEEYSMEANVNRQIDI